MNRCFIIAEAGVNHNGSLALALELVDIAAAAGADAVKFQTFRAESLVTPTAPKAAYQIRNTGGEQSQFAMLKSLELNWEDYPKLIERCKALSIEFMSTPFDEECADFLEKLGMATFKIPSGEITNEPLLRHIGKKQRRTILSTGMSTIGEVERAVDILHGETGCTDLSILHCVSDYPAKPSGVNLRAMETMRRAFGLPTGYSDHTSGISISLAAVALGATVIEKHFTMSRTLPGPDHVASLEPEELNDLVKGIRDIEVALGDGVKRPTPEERHTAEIARKSIAFGTDLEIGHVVKESDLVMRRPGTGLPPSFVPHLIGRRLIKKVDQFELLSVDCLG